MPVGRMPFSDPIHKNPRNHKPNSFGVFANLVVIGRRGVGGRCLFYKLYFLWPISWKYVFGFLIETLGFIMPKTQSNREEKNSNENVGPKKGGFN